MKKFRLLLLCAFLCLAVTACNSSSAENATNDSSPTDGLAEANPSANTDPDLDTVALYIGEEPVNYDEFNFHVVTQINTYAASEEGQESGFDPTKSLTEQYYDSETTMEQKFADDTTKALQDTISMYLEATANGYEMGDWEKENIDSFFDNLNNYIEEEGITEQEAFLNKYGVEMSHDQVTAILERNLIGKAYETHLREQMNFTDEELETFYEEHKKEIVLPECNVVTLRIIHLATEQMALDVLEKFENGDKSEQSFIELVKLYSTDQQEIENEGLYTDMSPQNSSVATFDEVESWVFDSAREAGNYSMLSFGTGYGVVYFVEKGDPLWLMWSRFAKENYDIQAIIDQYPVTYPDDSARQ